MNCSDKLKRYFDIYIPTEKCNFTCSYCYVSQEGNASGKIIPIGHTPQEIRKALSMKRLGGVCLLNFCAGGETLLGDDILPIIYGLLEEGHYISIVTNGTITKCFDEMGTWSSNILSHVFIKFSFHYLELKSRKLLNQFFNNVRLMRSKGCSISLELMPHDDLMPYADEIKKVCLENVKALPHLTVGRDDTSCELKLLSELSLDEYGGGVWQAFDSDMFRYKLSMWGKDQRQFCYAGEWSCSLRLDTGDLYQCNGLICIDNVYDRIDEELHFKPVGNRCPHPHCWNCHAYLCLGVMPDVEAPTYADMRDRLCSDGSRWLNDDVREFFSQKLENNNIQYTKTEKRMINENAALTQKCCGQEQLIKQYQNENTDYKNWVANLQNQVNDRLTELEEYKDWVHNLQAQIEERNKENREYKDWVNNLQVQIDSLKNGNN